MQVQTMDPLLIEIYNIRNLESIKLYDMVIGDSNNTLIVPALLVYYDGKSLNLCAKDNFFTVFAKKVAQVYQDEKDLVMEDGLTDPFHLSSGIDIDEHSKSILTSGKLENIHEMYKFYDGKDFYDGSLLFQKDEVNLILPIIKYHIQKFLSITEKSVSFDDKFDGYRDNYTLTGTINGVSTTFPFVYDKISDNYYVVKVGNILGNNAPIKITVEFKKDRIEVVVSADKYDITGEFSYVINNGVIKEITDIKHSGLTIHYTNTDLDECEAKLSNIVNFDQTSNLRWFSLPWQASYGIDTGIVDLNESEKIVEIKSMYLGIVGKSFIKKEFVSKSYHRSSVNAFKQTTSLDEIVKGTIGICLSKDGTYLIETAFQDTLGSSGYYNDNLENKYFYHVTKSSKGITGINGKQLINIGKKDGIFDNGDTLNHTLVLQIIGEK